MAVVWRPRTSRLPDLIIFQRARRVGRVVRYLFLSILKQLGSRPFSSKLAGAAHKTSVVRHGYHQMLAIPAFPSLRPSAPLSGMFPLSRKWRSRRRSSKLGRELLTIRRRSAWALSAIAPAVVGCVVATSVQAVAVACLSLRFAVSQGAYSSVPSAVRLVELHP